MTGKIDKAKPLTKSQLKLIDCSTEISTVEPGSNDMAFTHSILCQVGLPRKKVEGREFMRRSGDAWLALQAGWIDEGNGPVAQPLPYGAMPRLALAWVSSYAVRNKTREITIGRSASEFLTLMGMDNQGTRYKTLRDQMHALASCRLQLGFKGRTYSGVPVEQFDAWQKPGSAGEYARWPGIMTLSDGYYNGLIESAVPLDNRALHALKGSALSLDIYTWLAHRLHRIEGKPVRLFWANLRDQFAQEYQGKDPDKDFKKSFLPALRDVLAVYPKAKVIQIKGGIMLYPSPPPIPYKAQ